MYTILKVPKAPRVPDLIMKAGDTLPAIETVLTENGAPLSLLDMTSVKFHFRSITPGSTTQSRVAASPEPRGGVVRYAWVKGDLTAPGDYLGEFELSFGTDTMTFPVSADPEYANLLIRVIPALL